MSDLAEHIRRAIREEHYVFGAHADQRLRERKIMGWQVVAGIDGAKIIHEKSDSIPNPTVEFEQLLADGTKCKVVWAWIRSAGVAKLVTVYFLDR